MAGELTLRVITPERIVLDTTASSVRVPAVDGSMGILNGHAHMVAALDIGELSYSEGGQERALFVSGGFTEVRDNTVRVVTEAGERSDEIDEARANESEVRARKRLDERRREGAGSASLDVLRAELALRRARVRLKMRRRS